MALKRKPAVTSIEEFDHSQQIVGVSPRSPKVRSTPDDCRPKPRHTVKTYWLTVGLLASCLPMAATAQTEPRTIAVRATGTVTVAADELRLPLELTTSGEDFAKVKGRNDQLLEQVLDLVDSHRLRQPAEEATTGAFDYSVNESGQKGYFSKPQAFQGKGSKNDDPFAPPHRHDPPLRMSRKLTLRFDDLSQATELLAELTDLDEVRNSHEVVLSTLQAGLKDPEPHQRKARRLAVRMCKEHAEELVEASGDLHLGAPLKISEEPTSVLPSYGRFTPPTDDPFGDPFGHRLPRSKLSLPIGYVAYQRRDVEENEQSLPAAQITVSVSVNIVYEAVLRN
jgi:uncharacterized protein YggE